MPCNKFCMGPLTVARGIFQKAWKFKPPTPPPKIKKKVFVFKLFRASIRLLEFSMIIIFSNPLFNTIFVFIKTNDRSNISQEKSRWI